MTRTLKAPGSMRVLQSRLQAAATGRGATYKRLHALVANVVLCQMLPASAVKGGTGLKLRFGDRMTRATPDLDTAFRGDMAAFMNELNGSLASGWSGFTGKAVLAPKRTVNGVPEPYVMQPLIVSLQYCRRDFRSGSLEVGYDELEATTEVLERTVSAEVLSLFAELALDQPAPVPVLPLHHQISQKLHACTAPTPKNDRAHDLVDLQLMAPHTEEQLVAITTRRLFTFRQQHEWPPPVVARPGWSGLYTDAAHGLDVLPTVEAAVEWTGRYVCRLNGL